MILVLQCQTSIESKINYQKKRKRNAILELNFERFKSQNLLNSQLARFIYLFYQIENS